MDTDLDAGMEAIRLPTNGVELGAIAAGPEDGPLVILLHGFPEIAYAWRRQIAALSAAGLRVLAPDQRGYNLSSKPHGAGQYALGVLAQDVLGLADALGRERFSVVGHDWGPALAWHLAGSHSSRILRAAVINGPHPATVWRHTLSAPSQALKGWYIGFFQMPLVPEWTLRSAGFAWLRWMMETTARPGTFTAQDMQRYCAAWRQPGALSAMLNWYRALPLYSGSLKAERINVPVRAIWGDRDAFLNAQLAEAGLALCSRGEAFHVSEATHWICHEEPERVNRLLLEFLGS
jgi:epoxide hydrolase 4